MVTSSDSTAGSNGMGKSVKLNLRGSKILELLEKDDQEAKTKVGSHHIKPHRTIISIT